MSMTMNDKGNIEATLAYEEWVQFPEQASRVIGRSYEEMQKANAALIAAAPETAAELERVKASEARLKASNKRLRRSLISMIVYADCFVMTSVDELGPDAKGPKNVRKEIDDAAAIAKNEEE